ncbi:MAG: hypothetical protein U5Q16_17215 [Gammaproteobacteria bacterium]|nr:hypothetical protein [Gammaproteobacteria bacterium]
MGLLTWLLFGRLYAGGRLERGLDRKANRQALKRIRKETRKDKADFLNRRWMKFGGGFYGIAGLWTFVCIEATELTLFIANFNGFAELFGNGVLNFVIGVLANQFVNFVTALLWFGWWPGDGGGVNAIVVFAAAYGGYLGGLYLARRGMTLNSLGGRISALWQGRAEH